MMQAEFLIRRPLKEFRVRATNDAMSKGNCSCIFGLPAPLATYVLNSRIPVLPPSSRPSAEAHSLWLCSPVPRLHRLPVPRPSAAGWRLLVVWSYTLRNHTHQRDE